MDTKLGLDVFKPESMSRDSVRARPLSTPSKAHSYCLQPVASELVQAARGEQVLLELTTESCLLTNCVLFGVMSGVSDHTALVGSVSVVWVYQPPATLTYG